MEHQHFAKETKQNKKKKKKITLRLLKHSIYQITPV